MDTSGTLAALDESERLHKQAARALDENQGPFVLSPFVAAELDYLLANRRGQDAELGFLGEVAEGGFLLDPFDASDVAEAKAIITRYRDLQLGLADASILVLAERHGCLDVLTLDERHFRAVRGPGGQPLRLLPADS